MVLFTIVQCVAVCCKTYPDKLQLVVLWKTKRTEETGTFLFGIGYMDVYGLGAGHYRNYLCCLIIIIFILIPPKMYPLVI